MSQPKVKTCQNCKTDFTIEPEDFEFYQKIDVPEPTFCPECRAQRRMVFWNPLMLYKRKCDFSGEQIFSEFSPEAPIKVYDQQIWNSDKWDAMEYGRAYDLNKTFFEQMRDLIEAVPFASRVVVNVINSDYSKNTVSIKNCYLVMSAIHVESCAYQYRIYNSRDCYDGMSLDKCELCYQGFMLSNCYKSFYSSHCTGCQEIYFCRNCVDCQNCFGCANLKHKKYYIFNQEHSQQDYGQKLKEFNIGSYQNNAQYAQQAESHYLNYPVKYMHGRKNVNVIGDYINNSKDISCGYVIKGGENLRYCQFLDGGSSKDVSDQTGYGSNTQNTYECVATGGGVNNLKFSNHCITESQDIEYSIECHSSSYLFACVGLRHKQYCILNRQYTKESFDKLRAKIIQQMNEMPYIDKQGRVYKYGEFFPPELSPFAYNETIANEYFPKTKEQATKEGYRWYDKPKSEYTPTLQAKDIPDHISDIDDSILKDIIECQNKDNCSGSTVFRLIQPEYDFYKQHNLPIPRLCPDCRHKERIKQRNPLRLYRRQCMNLSAGEAGKPCPNEFETTYAPDRPEIIYCEECYQKEVE